MISFFDIICMVKAWNFLFDLNLITMQQQQQQQQQQQHQQQTKTIKQVRRDRWPASFIPICTLTWRK